MSDLESILLTACVTLIGGVILLVVAELLKVLVILPAQKTREHIQVVLSRVDFYSNKLTNFFSAEPTEHEIDVIKSITKDLREAATDLRSNYTLVPMKKFLSLIKVLPSPERISVAFTGLIYLHNSILYEDRRDYIINLIEMNDNQINRIHAALTGKNIPKKLALEEQRRQ
jgi:hypothetical protein